MRHLLEVSTVALAFGVLLVMLGTCGCNRSQAAEAAYLGEHLRCIEEHDEDADINACRAQVRKRWGVTLDAGGSDAR